MRVLHVFALQQISFPHLHVIQRRICLVESELESVLEAADVETNVFLVVSFYLLGSESKNVS